MLLLGLTVFPSAVVMIAVGTLSGWLLRSRFQTRSSSTREESRPSERPRDGAALVGPPRPAAADAATSRSPITGEASAPCVRNTFSLAMGHRLAESARRGDPLGVIIVRIDNYQRISDRHGMQAGNEILDTAGKLFIASVRAMDWVARFDAITFAFMLPSATHSNTLLVAERLRTNISAAALSMHGTPIALTLSIGATEFCPGDDSEAILRRAEEAMIASVRAGGNCIQSCVGRRLETACSAY